MCGTILTSRSGYSSVSKEVRKNIAEEPWPKNAKKCNFTSTIIDIFSNLFFRVNLARFFSFNW